MPVWAPEIDPAHPLECTQAKRYVLQRLSDGSYVSIRPDDQGLGDVSDPRAAYLFHTHEAAQRAAGELTRLGGDGFDVLVANRHVTLRTRIPDTNRSSLLGPDS